MAQAGYMEKGQLFPTEAGTPQGGIISPILATSHWTDWKRPSKRWPAKVTKFTSCGQLEAAARPRGTNILHA
jgi:retron-type reverse transcriptase